MSGDARCCLALHMQEVFNRRWSHCLVAEGDGRVVRWVGSRMDLGNAFESAGMQQARQVKHTAVSRWLGVLRLSGGPVGTGPFNFVKLSRYCFKVLWNSRRSGIYCADVTKVT